MICVEWTRNLLSMQTQNCHEYSNLIAMIVLVSSTVRPSRHFVIRYFITIAKVFKPTNKIYLCQRSTSAILEILALERLRCSSENNTTSGFDVRSKLSDEWLKPAVPSLIGLTCVATELSFCRMNLMSPHWFSRDGPTPSYTGFSVCQAIKSFEPIAWSE